MADAATTKIDIVIKTESKFRTGGVKEDALRWNYVHKIIEWWTGEEWKSVYVESQGQGVTGSITFKLADGKTYQFTGSEVIDLSNGVYYAANCKDAEHAAEADEAVHALNADNADFANNAEKAKRDEQGAIIHETYATIAWVNEIVNGTNEQIPASGMSWEVDANYENGAILTLPSSLKYAFGMHSLRLALDGAILSQGISYNEVDMGVATSSKINLMCALEKGMILDIWIIPVGINTGMLVLADAVQAKLNQYRDEADTVHIEVVESRSVIRNEVNSAHSTLQGYVAEGAELLTQHHEVFEEVEALRTEYIEYLKTCEVFMDSSEASAYAARAAADEAIDNVVMSRELLESTAKQVDFATEQAQIATNHAKYITSVVEDAESHLAEAKNTALTEIQSQEDTSIQNVQSQEDTSIQNISDHRDAVIAEVRKHLPVGFEYFQTNPNIRAGSIALLGFEVSRAIYSALWEWVQKQDGYLITEAEWQRLAEENQGAVPFYSDGDGSTTFRVPALTVWCRGANTIEEVGDYLSDMFSTHTHAVTVSAEGAHVHSRGTMDITGTFRSVDLGGNEPSTGAFYDVVSGQSGSVTGGTSSGFDETIDFIASRTWVGVTSETGLHEHTVSLDAIGGEETRPKTVVGLYCVFAFGTATSTDDSVDLVAVQNAVNATKTLIAEAESRLTVTLKVWE